MPVEHQDFTFLDIEGHNVRLPSKVSLEAEERLRSVRLLELEHEIFVTAFNLIESFYRSPKRSRITGLTKAYKHQYETLRRSSGISKHYATFHRDLIDWQRVLATASGQPLPPPDYDTLFEYADAIDLISTLIMPAFRHAELLSGLTSTSENAVTSGQQQRQKLIGAVNDCSTDFQRLATLIRMLLERLKSNEQFKQNSGTKVGNDKSGFLKIFSASNSRQAIVKNDFQREIDTWQSFVERLENPKL